MRGVNPTVALGGMELLATDIVGVGGGEEGVDPPTPNPKRGERCSAASTPQHAAFTVVLPPSHPLNK